MKKIIVLSALACALIATTGYVTFTYGRRYYRRRHGYRRHHHGSDVALAAGSLLTGAVMASQISRDSDVSGKEALRAVGRLEDAVRSDLKRILDRLEKIENDISKVKPR